MVTNFIRDKLLMIFLFLQNKLLYLLLGLGNHDVAMSIQLRLNKTFLNFLSTHFFFWKSSQLGFDWK
jgi:hypothetical protein